MSYVIRVACAVLNSASNITPADEGSGMRNDVVLDDRSLIVL